MKRTASEILRGGTGEHRLRISGVVPIVFVSEEFYIPQSCSVQGGSEIICDERGFVARGEIFGRVSRSRVERLVLHRQGIDGDPLLLVSLHEIHEILRQAWEVGWVHVPAIHRSSRLQPGRWTPG